MTRALHTTPFPQLVHFRAIVQVRAGVTHSLVRDYVSTTCSPRFSHGARRDPKLIHSPDSWGPRDKRLKVRYDTMQAEMKLTMAQGAYLRTCGVNERCDAKLLDTIPVC